MKKRFQGMVIGFFTVIFILFAVNVFAAESTQTIQVIFGRVKLFVDGRALVEETLLYNGTTYVPLRAAAEALGVDVGWDGNTNTASLTSKGSSPVAVAPIVIPTPVPTSTPTETIGQRNALMSAKQYLNVMVFSYQGLINQLEFENYSKEDATYAADNCGADWNEQAVKSAKAYLDIMPFSRDGLIGQLEYEGFTREQAIHGAVSNGY